MIDYTSLLKKLSPDRDGEPHTHLRTGTVDAVNSDGTLDIMMSGGIIVPSVPKLATAYAPDGAAVQMISLRGSLLVIGAVGSTGAMGAIVKTGSVTGGPSNATSYTVAASFGMTFPGVPNVHINLNNGAGDTAQFNYRAINISTTGFTLFGYRPSTNATFSTAHQWTAIYAP
jgi:hypothetical protein